MGVARTASAPSSVCSWRPQSATRTPVSIAYLESHPATGIRSTSIAPALIRPPDARGPPYQWLLGGAVSVRLNRRVRGLRSRVVVNGEISALRGGCGLGRTSRSPSGLSPAVCGAESQSVGGGAYPEGFVDRYVSRETMCSGSSRIMTVGGQGPTLSGRPRNCRVLSRGLRGVGTGLLSLTWDGRAVNAVRIAVRSRSSEA